MKLTSTSPSPELRRIWRVVYLQIVVALIFLLFYAANYVGLPIRLDEEYGAGALLFFGILILQYLIDYEKALRAAAQPPDGNG